MPACVGLFHLFKDLDTMDHLPTTSALRQARRKLLPSAFVELNERSLQRFEDLWTQDGSLRLWEGYRVFAVDGSYLNFEPTPELQAHFGLKQGTVQGLASFLYDVLNQVVYASCLGTILRSEKSLLFELKPHLQTGSVLVLDRLYGDFSVLSFLVNQGCHFVVRLQKNTFKEARELVASPDTERVCTLRTNYNQKPLVEEEGWPSEITVRFVKVFNAKGEAEVLVTSLLEIAAEKVQGLYRERWGIETYFDRLKNLFELERWSSGTLQAVQQDFYGLIYLSNLESMIASEVEEELNDPRYTAYVCDMKLNSSDMKNKISTSVLLAMFLFGLGSGAKAQCLASFTWSDSSGCVTFTNTSIGFNPLFTSAVGTWTFGDGTSGTTSGMNGITHCYNSVGPYVVCLTMTDTVMGCTTATYCDSIYTNGSSSTCDANYTYTVNGCDLTVTDQSTAQAAIIDWSWSFGDGTGATTQNASHTYGANGTYYVCLTITTADTCTSSQCYWVNVTSCGGGNPCQVSYTWAHDTTMAYTILLYMNGSFGGPAMNYFWDFGDGTSSTQAFPSHVYAGAGTYNVCVTVSDSNCTATFCDSIQVTYKTNTPFSINVVSGATGTKPADTFLNFNVYPNPFTSDLKVEFGMEHAAPVSLQLLDITGRVVFTQDAGWVNAGDFSATMNPGAITSGVYMLRVTAGDKAIYRKVLAN